MPRRVWLSLGLLATGAALMVAAQLAGAAPERRGGIFKVGTTGASVQIDPQLSYVTTGWWLEYATAAKLYNYPAGRQARARGRLEVHGLANGGRYTFFIRKGFRFSDGTPVTARSFKYAIDRDANHDLASPGAQFITNPNGDEHRRRAGREQRPGPQMSAVFSVRGNRLIIELEPSERGVSFRRSRCRSSRRPRRGCRSTGKW